MEPVYLGQPVFNPRPISPLNFEPFEPLPEDVIFPGSSDEDSEGTRKRKKRRREDIGHQYLRQQAGYTITFKLKGPFENGWRNPYRDHGVVLTTAQVADMRNRREKCDKQGVRASSPIDLTSGAEDDEDGGKQAAAKLRDRKGTVMANGWLASNFKGIPKRQSEDTEAGSPTPRRRRARVHHTTTLVSEGLVGKGGAVALGETTREVDRGKEDEDGLGEEELEKLVDEGIRPEERRSLSVELEYSSESQSRHRATSEISEGGHLNVQSPTTKPRLERRVLVKRTKVISQRLRMQQYGSDAMDELLLEKEVLDDRVSALSAVIADMKESGNDKATVRRKRGRDQAQRDSGVNILSVDEQKKIEQGPKEVFPRLKPSAKAHTNMETTEGREIPRLPSHDVYRSKTEGKPGQEVFQQGVQTDPIPDLLRMPSFRTDSSEISRAVSSGSHGKQRSARAIRKSEKRREHKREKRHKAALEKVVHQQDSEALGQRVDHDDDRKRLIESGPSMKALTSNITTQQPTRLRERKPSLDFVRNGQVTGKASSVKNEKLPDTGGNSDAQQNEEPLSKIETIEQPRRPARKKYQSGAKDKDNETTIDNENIVFGIKNSEAIVAGTKGERVPIIIVDDYDSLVSSSNASSCAACPTGWKPYKWLPGGHDYAERVLREHLALIEASGPSLDPFKSSVSSSSNESSNAARERNVRETKADLQKVSNGNIVDLTDFEMPEAPPAAAQLKALGVEVGSDLQHKTLMPQIVSRRTSVDSVDTAWKKDQSSFFGESLSSGLKGITTNRFHNREYSKQEDEVQMRRGKVNRNNLTSTSRRVLGQLNSDGREPAAGTKSVLSKDSSDQGDQVTKLIEEEKRASKESTAAPVSFMDMSSEDEAGRNDPKSYTHSLKDVSPGRDQALSNPLIPSKVKVQSGVAENVLAAKQSANEAPLVAADVMARDDVDETSREGSAAVKGLSAEILRNKKDKQNSLNERRSSREEFLQSLRMHVSQKAGKNLLTSLDTSIMSPHVLPASTNSSLFQYNRVDTASRSTSSDYNPPKRKQKPTTPVLTKAQPKRRISFNPNGNIKSGLEAPVNSLSPGGSQASPIVIEEAPVRMRASPTRKSTPSLIQKPSEGDISKSVAEVLPEAQVVAEKLPSGPSTNLLETDKQSLKFTSMEETDPADDFSTQAELAKAQQSFQRDLQSPVKLQEASSPAKSPLRRNSTTELHQDNDTSRTPLLTSKDPYVGAPRPHSGSEELPSTQAMVDAMSPFAISTIKKPRKFLHSFTRPAAAVYGYIWGSSQEERNTPASKPKPVDASSRGEPAAPPTDTSADLPSKPLTPSPKPPEPTLEPAVTFTHPPFDMATSDDSTPEPAYSLSRPSEFIKPPRRASRKLNSALPPSDEEESDFEETQKRRGLVRDDRGRWSNLTAELSTVTPSQRTLRSYTSPRAGSTRKGAERGRESLSQDGQRRSGVEAAVEEAESWLGTWDVEGEVRRMGTGTGVGGSWGRSGSGSGRGVPKGESNRVVL